MQKLAKFLSWCFGAAALVFSWFFLSAAWSFLVYVWRFVHEYPGKPLALRGRQEMVIAGSILVPLACAILYGMSWWTTQKNKPKARAWAIGASVANLGFAIFPFVLSFWIPTASRVYIALAGPELLLTAAGVTGLIVFSRRDALPETAGQATEPARLPGDGTSHLVDVVVQLAGIAGVVAGLVWLGRWGESRNLYTGMGLWFWVELWVADLISVAGHELGHVSVGRALGMRMRGFVVGPFQWRIEEGRWKFRFQASNFFAFTGGSAGMVPTKLDDTNWRDVWMTAAGPAASLCVGLAALWAMLNSQGQPWAPAWSLLGYIAVISLVAFVINLFPIRPEANYSDGAQIYQLLTRGPWVDVHRAFSAVSSSLVTPLRARDYDAETLRRAAEFIRTGHQGFLLRMFSFTHFLDCGQIPEALAALAEAEKVYEQSASDLPGELLAYFVYANAFLKPDAARARHWWGLMEAKKARQSSTDYWLARTSILWVEGQRDEALKAWEQGNAKAQKLPQAGAYEFDRSLFTAVRPKLDSPFSMPEQVATS
jgi:Zn-dependent protease